MVNYSLTKDRYIGMIQTDSKKNLYQIGCIGKIQSFNETEDGRYLISLQGTNCFKIIKEEVNKFSFRVVNVKILENIKKETIFDENEKFNLIDKYKKYIGVNNININLDDIDKIEFSQLLKFIAMVSPFKDIDKQALLETKGMPEFYKQLLSIIEMELVGDFSNKLIN